MESTGGTADRNHDYFPLCVETAFAIISGSSDSALNERFIRRSSE
jgi:hypothetical protein